MGGSQEHYNRWSCHNRKCEWQHTSLVNTFCYTRLFKMRPRFQALLVLTDVWKEYLCHGSDSPVQWDGSAAQVHHCRKEVHVTGGLIYLPATWDLPWPAQDSRDPDPALPVGGLPCYSEKHINKSTGLVIQNASYHSKSGMITKALRFFLRTGHYRHKRASQSV